MNDGIFRLALKTEKPEMECLSLNSQLLFWHVMRNPSYYCQ